MSFFFPEKFSQLIFIFLKRFYCYSAIVITENLENMKKITPIPVLVPKTPTPLFVIAEWYFFYLIYSLPITLLYAIFAVLTISFWRCGLLFICEYTCACNHTCNHIYNRACVYVCIRVYIYIYIYLLVYIELLSSVGKI